VTVKPDAGAGIGRWDLRAARFALAAVLLRRPEAYHAKVRALDEQQATARAAPAADGASEAAAASIHEIVTTKQEGLSRHLRYDPDERRSGLLRFLAADSTADEAAEVVVDLGDFASGPWDVVELGPGAVVLARDGVVRVAGVAHAVSATKSIRIEGDRLDPGLAVEVTVTNRGSESLTARIALEWSTMLLGGGGNPAAWLEVGAERVAHDARLRALAATSMTAGNDFLGIRVATTIDPPQDVWVAPIETVSNSEAGFELVYQGSASLVGRVVTLEPGRRASIAIRHEVTVGTDARAATAPVGPTATPPDRETNAG